jgi:hypothetical protein
MTTIADVLSGPRLVHSMSQHRRCGSCGNQLPVHRRAGASPKHCQTDRCRRLYYSGQQRTKCQRCGGPIARGRAAQRAAVCGRCFVDLVTLAGGH